jgi:hypothetical protein
VHISFYDDSGNDLRYASNAIGVTASVSSLDFGEVLVGGETERIVTLSNIGAIEQSIAPAIAGTSASEFSVGGGCTSLLPGAECYLIVTFAPTASGAHSATLDAAGVQVALSGSGVEPEATECDGCGCAATSSGQAMCNLLLAIAVLAAFRFRRISGRT